MKITFILFAHCVIYEYFPFRFNFPFLPTILLRSAFFSTPFSFSFFFQKCIPELLLFQKLFNRMISLFDDSILLPKLIINKKYVHANKCPIRYFVHYYGINNHMSVPNEIPKLTLLSLYTKIEYSILS